MRYWEKSLPVDNSSLENRGVGGQILVEIIVASLIIISVSVGITYVLNASIRGVESVRGHSRAVFLSREIAEAVRAIAKEDWHNITNLATSSANTYSPTISGGKWVATSGPEVITLDSLAYSRSFYVDDVYRSTSTGNIVSGGGYRDPSTAKISIAVTWTDAGTSSTFTQAGYLSRAQNDVYPQTDWSGGAIGDQVVTSATTTFATSTSVDFSSATGSIKLSQ